MLPTQVAEGDRLCILDVGAVMTPLHLAAASGTGGAGGGATTASSAAAGGTTGSSSAAVASAATVSVERLGVRPLSRTVIGFDAVTAVFCPLAPQYLAVAGLTECVVLTVAPRGEVMDRLTLDLSLSGGSDFIVQVAWVPGSQTELVVTTAGAVKVRVTRTPKREGFQVITPHGWRVGRYAENESRSLGRLACFLN
jgi:hypothetical protein